MSVYLSIPPSREPFCPAQPSCSAHTNVLWSSILVNWCYIIDLYMCRLHASPIELEYKAVGLPCISLIKIRWTNEKKRHIWRQYRYLEIIVYIWVWLYSEFFTVVSFTELFCCSENRKFLLGASMKKTRSFERRRVGQCEFSDAVLNYSAIRTKLNPPNSIIQIQIIVHEIERKAEINSQCPWVTQSSVLDFLFYLLSKAATQENEMIKGFNPKAKFYFILLDTNMLENISVFKIGDQASLPCKTPGLPTVHVHWLCPESLLKLLHTDLWKDIFIKLSWREAHECHFLFFFLPQVHLMGGSDPAATAVTRWLPPPLHAPFSSLFLSAPLLAAFAPQRPNKNPNRRVAGSKVTVKGDPAAPGARTWWGVDTRSTGWK